MLLPQSNTKRFLLVFSVLFYCLAGYLPLQLQAKTLFSGSNDSLLGFADSLLKEQDYYRAVGEYKRCLYLNPQTDKKTEIAYKIGLCYLWGEQYTEALDYFHKLAEGGNETWRQRALVKEGDSFYLQKDYQTALNKWNAFTVQYPQSEQAPRAIYLSGWAEVYQYHFKQAREYFSKVQTLAVSPEDLKLMAEKTEKKLESADQLPMRSPLLSMTLSIIPGLGQLYCDRKGDAITSFLVNGVFGTLAYDAFRRQDSGASIFWGVISGIFYAGNLYGGYASAFRFDKKVHEDYVKELEGYKLLGIEQQF